MPNVAGGQSVRQTKRCRHLTPSYVRVSHRFPRRHDCIRVPRHVGSSSIGNHRHPCAIRDPAPWPVTGTRPPAAAKLLRHCCRRRRPPSSGAVGAVVAGSGNPLRLTRSLRAVFRHRRLEQCPDVSLQRGACHLDVQRPRLGRGRDDPVAGRGAASP